MQKLAAVLLACLFVFGFFSLSTASPSITALPQQDAATPHRLYFSMVLGHSFFYPTPTPLHWKSPIPTIPHLPYPTPTLNPLWVGSARPDTDPNNHYNISFKYRYGSISELTLRSSYTGTDLKGNLCTGVVTALLYGPSSNVGGKFKLSENGISFEGAFITDYNASGIYSFNSYTAGDCTFSVSGSWTAYSMNVGGSIAPNR